MVDLSTDLIWFIHGDENWLKTPIDSDATLQVTIRKFTRDDDELLDAPVLPEAAELKSVINRIVCDDLKGLEKSLGPELADLDIEIKWVVQGDIYQFESYGYSLVEFPSEEHEEDFVANNTMWNVLGDCESIDLIDHEFDTDMPGMDFEFYTLSFPAVSNWNPGSLKEHEQCLAEELLSLIDEACGWQELEEEPGSPTRKKHTRKKVKKMPAKKARKKAKSKKKAGKKAKRKVKKKPAGKTGKKAAKKAKKTKRKGKKKAVLKTR